MTTMVAEVYDALVSAGADEGKARAAATAIAGYDQATLRADIAAFRSDLKSDMKGLQSEMASIRLDLANKADKTDVAVLKWAVGLIVAGVASIVARSFF